MPTILKDAFFFLYFGVKTHLLCLINTLNFRFQIFSAKGFGSAFINGPFGLEKQMLVEKSKSWKLLSLLG